MATPELNLEELAISNPAEYLNQRPNPREWNLGADELARITTITPAELALTQDQINPKKWNIAKTVGVGFIKGIVSPVADIAESLQTQALAGEGVIYKSPNMTTDEKQRLLRNAEYLRHYNNTTKTIEESKRISHNIANDLSQGFGNLITYALTGAATGGAGIFALGAGQAASDLESGLVERYISESGDEYLENYTLQDKQKDTALAVGYGVFSGAIESALGVEKLASRVLLSHAIRRAPAYARRQWTRAAAGEITKSAAKRNITRNLLARQAVRGTAGEFSEEFIQSLGEDAAIYARGYREGMTLDEVVKKALIAGIYGAIIGAAGGTGLYYLNRRTLINSIQKWNEQRGVGLNERQVTEIADNMLDETRARATDEINTRAEIKSGYGQAIDIIANRLSEQIKSQGWTRSEEDLAQYSQAVAKTLTLPAVLSANRAGVPLSTFINLANMRVINNVLYLDPITNASDVQRLIKEQQAKINDLNLRAKLDNADKGALADARKRLALLKTLNNQLIADQIDIQRQNQEAKAQRDAQNASTLAPASTEAMKNAQVATAEEDFVYVGNKKIPAEYAIVELSTIQPSHIKGVANQNFTNKALQNRAARGTTTNQAILQEQASNFKPELVLTSPNLQSGAPFVNAKGEVIAGNGRTEIIRGAYETNPEGIENYKTALVDLGFDISGFNQPVLVRRNDTLTTDEQVAAADISNVSEISAFDHASRAAQDSKYLADSASAMEFADKLPINDRQGLMLNNGRWDIVAVKRRYADAVMSWICGNDATLFENLVLTGGLSQKITDGIVAQGSKIYNLQTRFPDIDIRQDIYRALIKSQTTNKRNFAETMQLIELDGHDVMPENAMLFNFIFSDQSTISNFLSNYADIAISNREAVASGENLLGDTIAPLSKKDLYAQAYKMTDEQKRQQAIARGKDYQGLFAESAEIKDPNLLAAFVSYQNQFAAPADTLLNQESFNIAIENAKLDAENPAYTSETINIDGIERTVYNSNGDRIAKSEQALRNFYNWFGDSKVVDKKGRPLVVYHGTGAEFDTFDYSKIGIFGTSEGLGFYTTENLQIAQEMAELSARRNNIRGFGVSMPLYVSIQNPITNLKQSNFDKREIIRRANELGNQNQETVAELGENWVLSNFNPDLSDNTEAAFDAMKNDTDLEFMSEFANVSGAQKEILQAVKEITGYDGAIIPPKQLSWTSQYPVQVSFSNTQIKSIYNQGTFSPDTGNIYNQRQSINAWYDPELQAIVLGKSYNELSLPHELQHYFLQKTFNLYKKGQAGIVNVNPQWMGETESLFTMLDIDPVQDALTTVQQEKFAAMCEAYLSGLGAENTDNLTFKEFLHWIPEKYTSIANIGYLDEKGVIRNPILDQAAIEFFNKWYGNGDLASLPVNPEIQSLLNPLDGNGEIIPSTQKIMNNREKQWGQESEEQQKADAQLWRAIGENIPTDLRAAIDAAEERLHNTETPDDRKLPDRQSWFKTGQKNARQRAADIARKYLAKHEEHAQHIAYGDPEYVDNDTGVDRGMLIRAVMETVKPGTPEYIQLDHNLAITKSMGASTLSLSGDLSHRAYLDALREVEGVREMKAAINYAGSRRGALTKWNADINSYINEHMGAILATAPNSQERITALKAFVEGAKTKFSGNTTNAVLNQLDLTGKTTTSSEQFIKWANKQIRENTTAKLSAEEIQTLMKASVKAQAALTAIDSEDIATATAAAKDLRHWQYEKNKLMKANIGRFNRLGLAVDNMFGSYAPSAMLMSVNTLFVANIPASALNNRIIKSSARGVYGKNLVDESVTKAEQNRIYSVFKASSLNLAQMERPTSPSLLHGEKYTTDGQNHWYDFTFKTLAWGDNLFRIPTFVDTLARIASKNANGNKAKATALFKEYSQLNNQSEEAKLARKQALAVSNMAVFTQNGLLAQGMNHIRDALNKMSRGALGLDPNGFGLGNLLAPFLKTGANVAEMGVKATLAPVRGAIYAGQRIAGKEIPEMRRIELRADWKYFAMTAAITAAYAALTSDEDEWYTEPYESGKQYDPNKPYDSIRIGGVWIKLDMFGPLAIPLRVAAKLVKEKENGWINAMLAGYGFGAKEAIGDVPLLDTVWDNNLGWAEKQPGQWAQSYAYTQANKLVPAQVKSVTKAGSRALGLEVWQEPVASLKSVQRKFHRNYGLDGAELTTNDMINVITNRVKWAPQQ